MLADKSYQKSSMRTFGPEDISSWHTTVMAQRCEITPVLGKKKIHAGRKESGYYTNKNNGYHQPDNSRDPALSEVGEISVPVLLKL